MAKFAQVTKQDKFVTLVQTEILFECLKGRFNVSPGAVVSMAMEIPVTVLRDEQQALYVQALELVAWFFGGEDPIWMPEELLYEEVFDDDEDDYPYYEEEEYYEEEPPPPPPRRRSSYDDEEEGEEGQEEEEYVYEEPSETYGDDEFDNDAFTPNQPDLY